MKRLALILLLLLPTLAQAASWGPMDDRELRTRLENAPDPASGEEGMLLFEGRYYHHEDGLTELRVQRLTRVSSEWALEHVSDPRLRYDSSRQELEIHRCRTYLPDGEFVDSPINAFNDVTPGALTQAVDFLDIREMVVTHTGLVPGAIIFLDYSLRDTAPAGLPAGEVIFPHGDFPLLEMEIVAEGLFGETVNPEGRLYSLPEPDNDDDTLRWLLRELPAAPGEARHQLGDQLPHVQLSPLDGSEEVVLALAESIETAIVDTTGLGEWLDKFEAERPFLSDREALEAWLDDLDESTARRRIGDWHWRRAPRSVARVLETSVATPLERIALLTAAMRIREIPVQWHFPSLWQVRDKGLLPLPSLGDPLIYIPVHVTSTISLLGWQADPVANRLQKPGSPTLPIYMIGDRLTSLGRSPSSSLPSLYLVRFAYYWKHEDGSWQLEGEHTIPARLHVDLRTPETYLRNWLEADSTRVDALHLHDLQNRNTHFAADGSSPLPAVDERGGVQIELIMPPVTFESLLPPGMNRSHSACRALLFPRQGAHYHLTWILDLPEDREPTSLEPISASCPGGSFTATRELEDNRLTLHYDLEHNGAPVQPADYPAYREFVNAALDPAATRVILREREEN